MDTILVLDTSGSMAGAKINELKKSLVAFVNLLQEMEFGERVAIISFGKSVRVLSGLTQDYARLKTIVSGLQAEGQTPMTQALALAVEQLRTARTFELGPISMLPRVILFTDGEPDDRNSVGVVAKAMGDAGLPMVCIGVVGCDENLMRGIALLCGGMFLMAKDIAYLQLFFIRQVLLVAYVMEVKEQLQNLYNRQLLRDYLERKTNQPVTEEELDGFINFLQHIIRTNDGANGVQTYTEKGPHCCCCLWTFRNMITSFLFLMCLTAICLSGYSLHIALTSGYPGVKDKSTLNFAVSSLIISLILSCGYSVHLIYLRTVDNDDDSMLWLVEVLMIVFLLIPEVLLFVAVFKMEGTYVLPSAITLVTVIGVCCLCNCCVRCFTRK